MKKILIVLLIAFLILGIVSCGKAREKAAENMIENIIEAEAAEAGENVDIDVDDGGGSITISGEDGEISIQGNEDGMPWPSDKLPGNVPEVKGVKVLSVMDADTGVAIIFDNCNSKIAEDYIKQIEANGWEIMMNMDSEGFHMISATNSQNEMLQLSWDEGDTSGSLTYGKE